MTADVNQDRRVTVVTQGRTCPALSEGSRLCWALPPVHERSGFRATEPDRIQGDAVLPHSPLTAQSRITACHPLHAFVPNPASLASCSPRSRHGLATASLASPLKRRPALTAAARNAPLSSGRDKETACGRTEKLPPRCRGRPHPILILDNPSPIQG